MSCSFGLGHELPGKQYQPAQRAAGRSKLGHLVLQQLVLSVLAASMESFFTSPTEAPRCAVLLLGVAAARLLTAGSLKWSQQVI